MAPKGRRWTSAATSKKKKKPKEGGVVVVVTDMTDGGVGEDDEGDFVSRARKGK